MLSITSSIAQLIEVALGSDANTGKIQFAFLIFLRFYENPRDKFMEEDVLVGNHISINISIYPMSQLRCLVQIGFVHGLIPARSYPSLHWHISKANLNSSLCQFLCVGMGLALNAIRYRQYFCPSKLMKVIISRFIAQNSDYSDRVRGSHSLFDKIWSAILPYNRNLLWTLARI